MRIATPQSVQRSLPLRYLADNLNLRVACHQSRQEGRQHIFPGGGAARQLQKPDDLALQRNHRLLDTDYPVDSFPGHWNQGSTGLGQRDMAACAFE